MTTPGSGHDPEQHGPVIGQRAGMSLVERLRAPDSYGLLLVVVAGATIAAGAFDSTRPGRVLVAALLGAAVLFALRTSRARPRVRGTARILVPAAVLASAAVVYGGGSRSDATAAVLAGIDGLLILAALASIVSRLKDHLYVSGSTVLGAASIYLLLGLFFTSAYALIAASTPEPFYAAQAPARPIDHLYFSFVTMTTVGYGDLTPVHDLPRMVAVGEALTGQLYLVTVVALAVGNLGRARGRSRPGDGAS